MQEVQEVHEVQEVQEQRRQIAAAGWGDCRFTAVGWCFSFQPFLRNGADSSTEWLAVSSLVNG